MYIGFGKSVPKSPKVNKVLNSVSEMGDLGEEIWKMSILEFVKWKSQFPPKFPFELNQAPI